MSLKWLDKIKMEPIHQDLLRMEAINSRIAFLNNKVINKMKDIYFPNPTDRNQNLNYKYSDYVILLLLPAIEGVVL